MKVIDFGKIQTANIEFQSILKSVTEISNTNRSILIIGEEGTGRRTLAQMLYEASKFSKSKHKILKKDESVSDFKGVIIITDLQTYNFRDQQELVNKMRINRNNILWIAIAQSDFLNLADKGFVRKDLIFEFTKIICIPNLKQRTQDKEFLIDQILHMLSWVSGRILRVNEEARKYLITKDFKENISGLEKSLESAALACKDSLIVRSDLIEAKENENDLLENKITTLADMEKKLIIQTLQITQNNKSHAARLLGISIRTLRNKLSDYRKQADQKIMAEVHI